MGRNIRKQNVSGRTWSKALEETPDVTSSSPRVSLRRRTETAQVGKGKGVFVKENKRLSKKENERTSR
jgi:hypothetical protein